MTKIRALGDLGLVAQVSDEPGDWRRVHGVARRIEAMGCEGIAEVVPALDSVAVQLLRTAEWNAVAERVSEVLGEPVLEVEEGEEREIPVCYGGEAGVDLGRVARETGLTEADVIKRHTAGRYRVVAVGFAPGFPYLAGLDEELSCPRLETPRTRVPAGSVGIGGGQTGVYPMELPGGWNLIGRTALAMFDAAAAPPNFLRAGDVVRFRAIEDGRFETEEVGGEVGGDGALEIVDAGMLATVQDAGRVGYQSIGVTEGGAVDLRALRVGNLLVGNPREAAGLEWAVRGPKLIFRERRVVALTGGRVVGVPAARPFVVEAGEVLDLSRMEAGLRGYLAIDGGIGVEEVMGARGTCLAGGFGGWQGRALAAGDVLPLGEGRIASVQGGWWASPVLAGWIVPGAVRVRVMRGPEAERFGDTVWRRFLDGEYTVESDSDRMGVRLMGEALPLLAPLQMVSQPVVAGTVQVPGNGQPIVLMADRQSLGGYPRLATVAAVDMAVMAQAGPGDRVQFVECDLAEAEALRLAEEKDFVVFEAAVRERLVRRV